MRPWNSQRLPLFLADIDDIVCEFAAGGLHRPDGLDKRVGCMEVQMEFDGQDGVFFKRVAHEQLEMQEIESNTELLGGMAQKTK